MAAEPGTLYLVGTPIGNLEDITLRALRVLREADLIAAEDTRVTQVLLTRYDIHAPLLSHHAHSSPARRAAIVALLQEGKSVAVVTDAGMPGVSDPGVELVRDCAQAGLPIVAIPGPTAVVTALALSGIASQEFHFLGFLPAKAGPRREALARAADLAGALVFYEAPHRLLDSLTDMVSVLRDRPAVCARELTKKFEEVVRGRLSELLAHFQAQPPRGEMTVVVEGAAARAEKGDLIAGAAEAQELIAVGMSPSRAAAHVAKWRGLSRRELYRAVLAEREGADD